MAVESYVTMAKHLKKSHWNKGKIGVLFEKLLKIKPEMYGLEHQMDLSSMMVRHLKYSRKRKVCKTRKFGP